MDQEFFAALVSAADEKATSLLGNVRGSSSHLPHRVLASRVKLLISCHRAEASTFHRSAEALDLAREHLDDLAAQQGVSGLFVGGDNVNSPPDSAFSLNDLADAQLLLTDAAPGPDSSALRARLSGIIDSAMPALLTGGVHTPNHRWEISAALARFHRNRPVPALRARAEEWLAEGIDIDDDGFYSERSPNYAAHVSNPALLVLADVFGLPALADLVERNLTATLGLIRPDGSVETVQSRRQDQNGAYPLAPFLLQYRRLAIERSRPDLAWAAELAARQGLTDPGTLLAEVLLHPHLARTVPAPVPPAEVRSTLASRVSLATDTSPTRTLVTYGGSDYPVFRTIRSGLANNPTFARLFAGGAILDSLRLSRDFFGLGPFRAEGLDVVGSAEASDVVSGARVPPGPGAPDAGRHYRLTETVGASYFQPLPPQLRSHDGTYDLADDGRFSASMSFGVRDTDTVHLTTTVLVEPTATGADLTFSFEGPEVAWALELTFVPGGVLEGVEPIGAETGSHLVTGTGTYRVGPDVIRFGPGNGASPDTPSLYRPGQDYSFLGGTDAVGGLHVYVTGRSPGTYTLHLDVERG